MDLRKNLVEVQGLVVPTATCTALKWLTIDTLYQMAYVHKIDVTDNYFKYAQYLLGVSGVTKPKSFTFYICDPRHLSELTLVQACVEHILRVTVPITKLWV